ncbi:MAG: hypothetical protein WCC57_18420 [Paracoccaceae bacterium]
MGAVTIQQMADRVAALMEERLRIKGTGLAEKVAKGGRRLPRRVRVAAEHLAQFSDMSRNPKLLLQVDEGKVAEAYDICLKHLGGMTAGSRRVSALMNAATTLAFIVLLVAGLVVAVLVWRGYL